MNQREKLKHLLKNKNVKAFLAMIRYAEGTDRAADPYGVTYGYEFTIYNFTDHPANNGQWSGKVLPDHYCRAAKMAPGCKSTAAGAYQFIRPTWNYLKQKLGLTDFLPETQDIAALYLIDEKGAIEDIKAGRIEQAIEKVSKVWASLPGAGYNQPERKLASLINKFNQSLS
jgi:lysozyme